MSCEKLGILIDTSVFINWFNHKYPYNRLNEPIRKDSLYLVICQPLHDEYLERLRREYTGANYSFLELELKNLSTIIFHMEPRESPLIFMNHKDQTHLDCAHNLEHPAHLLISDDTHFKEIKDTCPLPVILTIEEFLNDNFRESAYCDAKSVCMKIKQIGIRSVFQQARFKPN